MPYFPVTPTSVKASVRFCIFCISIDLLFVRLVIVATLLLLLWEGEGGGIGDVVMVGREQLA